MSGLGVEGANATSDTALAEGPDAGDLAEVLGDPAIGGFEVDTLIDTPAEQVKRHIHNFCNQAHPSDLLLLYLSCHGVLDDRGELFYATPETERDYLDGTAVPAEWLNAKLQRCRARQKILVLDCCHSGAFARNAKGESALALQGKFGGRGQIVLTASGKTEYSFEGDTAKGDEVRSVFTHAVVQGLRSGEADRDKDGQVSVEDLYHYVYDKVCEAEPRQTPEWWVSDGEGTLVVAKSVRGALVEPVPLPKYLVQNLESFHPEFRESAVKVLAKYLDEGAAERATNRQKGLARSARERLQQISESGDIPKIVGLAQAALSAPSGQATAALSTGSAKATSGLKPVGEAASEIPAESPRGKAPGPNKGKPRTPHRAQKHLTQARVAELQGQVRIHHDFEKEHSIRIAAISPEGSLTVTNEGRRVKVWDLKTGKSLWSSKADSWEGWVSASVFSPDGARLATTGALSKTARIWDATTGKQLLQVKHVPAIGASIKLAFSPDGARLATTSADNTARIWDLTTRK